jgi:RimJ/RimL family protein N-acetyltransferase
MYADPEVIRFLEQAPLVRLGHSFRRESWARGLASEAAGACARYAYDVLQAPAVISLVHPDDVRSQRVAERGGAKVEREMALRGLPARVFLWPQH